MQPPPPLTYIHIQNIDIILKSIIHYFWYAFIFLDVILDDKLTWKSHARAQMKKGLRAL